MSTNAKKFLEKLAGGPLSFSMALSAYMDREELTQSALAEMLGVNKTYISNIMSGRKKVSIEKAVEIAEALDQPIGAFVQAAINDALKEAGVNYEAILKKAV